MKKNQYSDINVRESKFEEKEKVGKLLTESWKGMLAENAKAVQASLKKKQGVLKEADGKPVDDKEEAPTDNAPVEGGDTPAAAPEATDAPEPSDASPLDSTPVEGGDTPAAAPEATDAPAGGEAAPEVDPQDEQRKMKVDEFNSKFVQLPPGTEMQFQGGVSFADVVDEHLGAFKVVVFPVDDKLKGIHDAANILEPKDDVASNPAAAEGGEAASPEETMTPEAGEVPPADAGIDSPAPDAGGEPSPASDSGEVPPTEEPKPEEKDLKEEDEEVLAESARDPIHGGKKNWKLFMESRYKKT